MLSSYVQVQTKIPKQTHDSLTSFNGSPYLNLSYDLENYHTLLAHITKDNDPRWILFIAPPGKPNFSFLQQAGINKSRIITLGQGKITDQSELLKAALTSNNYATIVTWLNECDQPLQDEINRLGEASNSTCFIYCAQ